MNNLVIGRNRLDHPVPISLSGYNAYEAVCDYIQYELGIEEDCVARIWTTNLGASNELLMWDWNDGWEWMNDWYEGGDVVLFGVIAISDLAF